MQHDNKPGQDQAGQGRAAPVMPCTNLVYDELQGPLTAGAVTIDVLSLQCWNLVDAFCQQSTVLLKLVA